jgi:MtN3 and saliva related transmembrane protein
VAEWWATGLGVVAGLCSTASFVPQVLKTWRDSDTSAISLKMYLVTVSAFALWIAYGVMIGSWPVIVFNALSLVLSASILVMKIRAVMRGDH